MVANGIFMSKLYYLVPLWGNCEKNLVNSLQVLQNKAARAITGKSWFTPVRRLLKDCKWLSVNQIIFYQTVLQTHKVLVSGKPVLLKQKMNTIHPYRTRQAAGGGIWRGGVKNYQKNHSLQEDQGHITQFQALSGRAQASRLSRTSCAVGFSAIFQYHDFFSYCYPVFVFLLS